MITINAGIVNTGSGNVDAKGATTVVGDGNILSNENKQELLKLLAEIDKIAAEHPNSEYEEVSKEIKDELEKGGSKHKLKRCFQAIPSILTSIGTGIVANLLTPLVSSALALLI